MKSRRELNPGGRSKRTPISLSAEMDHSQSYPSRECGCLGHGQKARYPDYAQFLARPQQLRSEYRGPKWLGCCLHL